MILIRAGTIFFKKKKNILAIVLKDFIVAIGGLTRNDLIKKED